MSGRVAVIGAGSSGITAVKNFLEAGFCDVTCFERRDELGGLWCFREQKAQWEDEASVNRSTVINTSKEFMAFSDYPMPENYPNFCHNQDVIKYFRDYVQHFGLDNHILYNTEVVSLKKRKDFDKTGQWELVSLDHKSGQKNSEVFDFVVVANGHHGAPNKPNFPGLTSFQGQVMHSKEFKDATGHQDEKILVVGIGNSGCDIAVELSKYNKVYLSTRRGAWVLNRLSAKGMPWDLSLHKRSNAWLSSWMPMAFKQSKVRQMLMERFDHDVFGLTPDHPPGATHPTVNDELPNRIAAGMVMVKPDVTSFDQRGVVFEDGTREDIDAVVLSTGYTISYPFIDKSVLNVSENQVEMYKNMFLPELSHQTIVFLALIQPLGSIFPIAEMQSRLAARVFKGDVTLPSTTAMKADIAAKKQAMGKQYVESRRHTIQVDWLPFMDELASLAGCKPSLWKYLFSDPTLFWALLTGPGVPYQYRLEGPNTWAGARKAILTTMDRIKKPFETRRISKARESRRGGPSLAQWILVSALTVASAGFLAHKRGTSLQNVVMDLWGKLAKK